MAREFEVEVSSSATPEQILAAFGRAEYWHDRFAEFDNHTVLDDLTVDGGRTEVVTVQDLGHDALPSLLTKVYRCLLYTSPSPRDATLSRMPSSA